MTLHIPKLNIGDIVLSNYTEELFKATMPRITDGKFYIINDVTESIFHTEDNPHPETYGIVNCSRTGKPFKSNFRISCYRVDEKLDSGDFMKVLIIN